MRECLDICFVFADAEGGGWRTRYDIFAIEIVATILGYLYGSQPGVHILHLHPYKVYKLTTLQRTLTLCRWKRELLVPPIEP